MPPQPAPLVALSTWAPDLVDQNTNVSSVIINALPRADGYGPQPDLTVFTQSLPGPCRGSFFARNADGSVTLFGATATNLYQLNATTLTWTLVSAGGGPYPALQSTDNWQFAQFNTLVVAVQINIVPQVFTLGSSTAFATLGGSPPQASHIAIINRFIILSGLLSNYSRVQWSDLDNPTQWTAGVGLADFQDLPDGGLVHDVRGGDFTGMIFQDSSVRWLIFSPGSATTFDIIRISTSIGIAGQYSSITAGDMVFWHSSQGFKMMTAGDTAPEPIGKETVDRTFAAIVDAANLQLFMAAQDPTTTRVYWAFKTTSGQAGLFDTIYVYDWVLKKWSTVKFSGQFLTSSCRPGLTLEGLDAIAPGIITITGAADNGSGVIRLTISGLTAGSGPSNTNLNIANHVVVYGVVGTVEANSANNTAGNNGWRFTIVDATHIDLIGSVFVNAYVSGGQIGGSLDQLPFSLDTISVTAQESLAAFNSSAQLGFFNGPNLAATMDTPEQNAQGTRFFISSIRPKTDCTSAQGAVGWRDNAQATVAFTGAVPVNQIGECPIRIDGRYLRYRITTPYGATWSYASGVEPLQQPSGQR